MAVTYSLPYDKWYYENTSIWTLDYPPYFAWFECFLSQIGSKIDQGMVQISSTPYLTFKTVVFQRLTVIISDFIYVFASLKCSRLLTEQISIVENRRKPLYFVLATLLVCNVGLLFVDSIHFQYNGMLFGILLFSIAAFLEENYLLGSFYFAVLLNFKHIFAYMAPAYVIFLLKNYCFQSKLSFKTISIWNCCKLFAVLMATFGLSFGPFIYGGHLKQIISRLFPFKRGLTHAYWAPNFWSFYNFMDLILNKVSKKLFKINSLSTNAEYTSGLVQEFRHTVLPNVTPTICLILTLIFIIPFCCIALKTASKVGSFLKLLLLCAFSSYIFGWHVHEKAILLCIIPLTLLSTEYRYVKPFVVLCVVGHFSLFPLFFTQFETPLKYLSWISYSLFALFSLKRIYQNPNTIPFLHSLEFVYLIGFVPLELYCSLLHYVFGLDAHFKFLPLMITSVYCSLGVLYVWLYCCWLFLCDEISLDLKLYQIIWKR